MQAVWNSHLVQDRKEVCGREGKKTTTTVLTEFLFADDAAAVRSTREDIERAAKILDETTREWGLTISLPRYVAQRRLLAADIKRAKNAWFQKPKKFRQAC